MPNPHKPLSADTPKNPTDNYLVIGLVLAGVVAFLILAGAMFFNSDEKSADATPTPPSTEFSGARGGVGFGRRGGLARLSPFPFRAS